jgi:hypothetical protein
MFNAFQLFVMRPAQPIKVSYAGLSPNAWNGNILHCMLCISRLRASCWFDFIQLCKKNCSGVQSCSEIRQRMKEKRKVGRSPVRIPVVVRNKDWCFQERVYNGCAGLHNIQNSNALDIHPVCMCVNMYI